MSEDQSAHHTKNEIIIVKRRHDEEEGHHGGVWKIAYADFMTAMMAFFLVMWLVNAANDQTKAAVASYFNPIKLVDQSPSDRGIHSAGNASGGGDAKQAQARDAGNKPGTGAGGDTGHDKKSTSGDKARYSDADYFDKPFAVLAEIAQQSGEKANVSSAGEGGAARSGPATGASGGKAYRDPFDPDFWTQQVQTVQGPPKSERDIADPIADGRAARTQKNTRPVADPSGLTAVAAPSPSPAPTPAPSGTARAASAAMAPAAGDATTAAGPGAPKGGQANPSGPDARVEAAREAARLQAEIRGATEGTSGDLAKGISVKPVAGGVLVSITDRVEDGMFNVGSAVPRHDMVIAMQKIGRILAGRPGGVVIRGHTDARPFKGDGYDNWRLSAARAESAFYMLVNGGLDKSRVQQIAGFADRDPLVPNDPYADANRRIEILLKTGGGAG